MPTGSKDLVAELNTKVSQLLSANRKLQRQIEKLSERRPAAKTTRTVKRAARPVKKRAGPPKRVRKPVSARTRKTKTAPKKRRR